MRRLRWIPPGLEPDKALGSKPRRRILGLVLQIKEVSRKKECRIKTKLIKNRLLKLHS